MLILYLSWTSKKVHTHSPQLSFFVFGGFDAHPNRESLKSGNFPGLPGMDSETFRTFLPWTKPGARNQTWGGCFLMSELVFFFWWFFSPCQVLSPQFFWVSFVWQGGYNQFQKKVNKSTKKKNISNSTYLTALNPSTGGGPLRFGSYCWLALGAALKPYRMQEGLRGGVLRCENQNSPGANWIFALQLQNRSVLY